MSEAPDGLRLQYPFVVCKSNGGPYDDASFVSGVQFGSMMETLHTTQPEHLWAVVAEALVPQVDLLAMHEGYSLETEPLDGGWVGLTFEREPT